MQAKIKIGLTYTYNKEKHNNYVNWLKGNDDIEIIKLSTEDNNSDKVKELDAVVFSGGTDTHPRNYKSSRTTYPNAPEAFHEERDIFETDVFHKSREQQIPILCICRGMQLANCILGGDLTQDIGTANTKHRNEGADKKHTVTIFPNTLLNHITNVDHENINSAHHQCVNKPGNGLMINAKSEDGIVEGVEWADKKDKPFFLGVQWHPERMYKLNMETSPLSKNIRDYFINEIQKNKEAK
jgi:putative glutamine amidotransferase